MSPDATNASPNVASTPGFASFDGEASAELPAKRYEVSERLGEGGGGQVYAVLDHHLGREVALKVMHTPGAGSPTAVRRFVDEARLTARLEHPNILPLYDLACDDNGRWFFSMRKASGQTVQQLIREASAGAAPRVIATLSDRVDVILRVCDAVGYAHSRGVIHRDVKPANIVLGDFGEVTLLDWGTALDLKTNQQQEGQLVGTPLYMAPEQARAEAADERADIYGVGATLWHLLTLERPAICLDDAAAFWSHKQKGDLPEPPAHVPTALIAIAQSALAPDRADRYQSVAELRDALREWQHHQLSTALTDFARNELAALGADATYADYARITHDFQRAIDDWPENSAARDGLLLARGAHARLALQHGDLQLADDLLDPDAPTHSEIRAALADTRARVASTCRRAAHARLAMLAAVVAVLFAGAWIAWDWRRSVGQWHVLGELAIAPDVLNDLTPAFPGRALPVLEDGALRLPRGELFFLSKFEVTGNVRVEVDMRWEGSVDGFEILLRSRNDPPSSWLLPRGYSCQFGGFNGLVSFISQNRTGGAPSTADGLSVPLVPGRRYTLAFAVMGDEAAIEVDGVEQLRVRSLLPLGDSTFRHIGFRSWNDVSIYGLVVRRQALPARPSPLLAGDAVVAGGHYGEAVRAYHEVGHDFPGSDIADDALARAFLSSLLAPELARKRGALLEELLTKYPDTPYRQRCEEGAALDAWLGGDLSTALARAEQVLARFPESRIATKLSEASTNRVERPFAGRLLNLLARTRAVRRVRIAGFDVGDLSPLRGMPLVELMASATGISDLSPLRGMPLKQLDISRNPSVTDLSPLRGMPLEGLMAASTGVRDLSALRGAPIVRLNVRETDISDLSPLRGMPLSVLDCSHTRVRDLGPLRGMALEDVSVSSLELTDISVLSQMPMKYLDASGNKLTDCRALPPRSWNELKLQDNEISDISALAETSGSILWLHRNRISDVAPLASARWRKIHLGANPVKDVAPLARSGAQEMHLSGLPPIKLASLAASPVSMLDVTHTRVLDPQALPRLAALERLRGGFSEESPEKTEALAVELERSGRNSLATELRTQALLARGAVDELRRGAAKAGRTRLLMLPLLMTRVEALELVARLGGKLPVLSDPAVQALAAEQTPDLTDIWLDLGVDNGRLLWGDGKPAALDLVHPDVVAFQRPGRVWHGFRQGPKLWLGSRDEALVREEVALVAVMWDDE